MDLIKSFLGGSVCSNTDGAVFIIAVYRQSVQILGSSQYWNPWTWCRHNQTSPGLNRGGQCSGGCPFMAKMQLKYILAHLPKRPIPSFYGSSPTKSLVLLHMLVSSVGLLCSFVHFECPSMRMIPYGPVTWKKDGSTSITSPWKRLSLAPNWSNLLALVKPTYWLNRDTCEWGRCPHDFFFFGGVSNYTSFLSLLSEFFHLARRQH